MRTRTVLWSLLLAPVVAQGSEYGPLMVKAQSPLQAQAYTPMMRSGQVLEPGTTEWHLTGAIASVWAVTPDYEMDYYHNELNLGVRFAPLARWEFEVNYQYRFAADNGLDTVTEKFHDLFGLGQNGRDQVPKHRFYISAPRYGVLYEDFQGETLSNVLSGYAGYQLYLEGAHGMSAGLGLAYNYVGSGPFEIRSFEQIAQLNYSYQPNAPHHLHLTLGSAHSDDQATSGGLKMSDWSWMAGASYQYHLGERHRLLLEYHLYSGETKEVDELDEVSHEFLVGYRYHLERGALELTMIENVFNMDNSTDIAFTLGYRHKL
ncbi:DUF3187 family protein [Ferrimonas sediminicola]|uniref:DUF3187 family protein n=1 Tax=Ferrimonas sediminicola TaxID=2569538 RepID=A0A4U1BD53_9GAMM|nr:DUF3187 family protein [Ferrimonas sediminicola]TKB48662.1 DUF3187 family protein [Ferrimonas sediminicola]